MRNGIGLCKFPKGGTLCHFVPCVAPRAVLVHLGTQCSFAESKTDSTEGGEEVKGARMI